MRIKTIVTEWYQDYKLPSMFIGTASCSGKCCAEAGIPLSVCQNNGWRTNATREVDDKIIIKKYLDNAITRAIIFGGLEPFEQFDELIEFIKTLRVEYQCHDTVVIYTGYYEEEIAEQINRLKEYDNIVVKFGRYIPNIKHKFDEVLGVELASENQYARKIS